MATQDLTMHKPASDRSPREDNFPMPDVCPAVVRSEQPGRLFEMHILAVILIMLASCGSSLAEPRSTYVPPFP